MPELQKHPSQAQRPLIDFDRWAALAQSDPVAFEQERTRAIECMIQGTPAHKRQRLRCLQWKIDQIRGQCRTPMSACIRLSGMMWDSVVGPGGLKDALERLGDPSARALTRAPVVKLRRASPR
ncbi:MAG: DUF3135 domain-containing protein [Gammaproteobacteria bacterium]|jgi:hypothetical protein